MATKESQAIRANAAADRIEHKLIEEWGVKAAPLPRMNRDREALRMNQLELIADMLDAVERFNKQVDPRLQAAIEVVSKAQWTKSELEAALLGESDGTIE